MLRKDLKTLIYFFVQITAAWTFAWIIFYFLRQYGIEEYPYVTFSRLPDWSAQLATHIGVGLLSGLLYGITELVFERPYFQRHSYGRLILIKTLIYFIIAVVLMSAAVLILQRVLFGVILWAKVSTWLVSANFLVALFYFLCISILISLFRQMNYKFGPEVLRNMLIGKYHRPREEMRIFMFLDLQASTTIAEQLGHIRFSRLLQDCFFDLTEPVLRHRAEIYQYVGDEAVLCWPVKGGFKNNHCLHCYFDFLDRLEERADYYQAKYGLLPFFKAGVHYGQVTVAEVGVIKKEIAYHGDVLNTAARIQGRCNVLEQSLLVSGDLMRGLPSYTASFDIQPMDNLILKGKRETTEICGVKKREDGK